MSEKLLKLLAVTAANTHKKAVMKKQKLVDDVTMAKDRVHGINNSIKLAVSSGKWDDTTQECIQLLKRKDAWTAKVEEKKVALQRYREHTP